MTPLFSDRSRLLTSTCFPALAGQGIPGSNYVEFQPSRYALPAGFLTDDPDAVRSAVRGSTGSPAELFDAGIRDIVVTGSRGKPDDENQDRERNRDRESDAATA